MEIVKALEISLIITAIHVSMWRGMLFSKLGKSLRVITEKLFGANGYYVRKPLSECLICMGGIWTLILYPILFGFEFRMFEVMLVVIGINSIISRFVYEEL